METTQILTKLTNKHGQFGRVTIFRPIDLKKGFEGRNITKRTTMNVRAGVDYDNLKAVKEKRETGELPAENAGLPANMEWLAPPYLLKHQVKGTLYARLYPVPNNKPKTQYFDGDREITLDEIRSMMYAKDLPKNDGMPDCICVKLENIEELV